LLAHGPVLFEHVSIPGSGRFDAGLKNQQIFTEVQITMGRLGPLNSLAFGRSPFQPPELDNNGNFILGLHAHDAENKDFYTQQFDERGHPKNDTSKATVRAMQHAQNAVLETVGVVVRREEASKSAWQRQSKKRKVEDIVNENSHGIILRELGPFLMQSSMWWAISLRRRIQTFRSYLGPPVLHILRSEVSSMGLLSLLTDGLLPAIASYVINVLLGNMQSRRLEISFEITIRGTEYSWKPFTSFTAGLIIPLIVFPAKAFAVLQSLHLIPSTFHLSPWSFVPLTSASPVQLPQLPDMWSIGTGLAFAKGICYNAFIFSTISDLTKSYIHNAMYRVILLTLAPRPDHPDDLTIRAAIQDQTDGDSFSLPGIGPENNAERLSRARSGDFWTELTREMRLLFVRIKRLRNVATMLNPLQENPRPSMDVTPATHANDFRVRARSEARQRQMVRENLEHLRENEAERIAVQRQAHNMALADFGILPASDPDVDTFLLPAFEIFDSDSTATPEPVDLNDEAATGTEDLQEPPLLFDRFTSDGIHDREEREGEGRILASLGFNDPIDSTNAQDALTPFTHPPLDFVQNLSSTPSDPARESVLEEAASLAPEGTSINHTLEILSPSQTNEPSPSANIAIPDRSLTLPPQAPDSPLDRNATPPTISRNRTQNRRHIRRSHSVSQASSSTSAIAPFSASASASNSSNRASTRRARRRTHRLPPPRRSDHPGDSAPDYSPASFDYGAAHHTFPVPRHRVTTLSVFPAEMFAECAAGLVTSIVTLPLDTLYVRALVRGFLGRPSTTRAGASVAAVGLMGDVYGMGEWFGGSNMGLQGRLRYMGLMALMFGVQGCVSSLSWVLVTKAAIALGRQLGWGQL
jgi:hypothetical protein